MSSEVDKKVWDAANPEAPDGRCEIVRISKSQDLYLCTADLASTFCGLFIFYLLSFNRTMEFN